MIIHHSRVLLLVFFLGLLSSGCAIHHRPYPSTGSRFQFPEDAFAYENELKWVYNYDENGKWTTKPREPEPTYTLRCYALARSARQFFQHARFDPSQPIADETTYRKLVKRIVCTSPRKRLPEAEKIVIPGYENLQAFSQAQENLLKEECGSAWESYCHLGNWRMVFPFSRRQQEEMAKHLATDLGGTYPIIVHVGRFPQLTINHAILVYAVEETDEKMEFATYDPNYPEHPILLTYNRATRTFSLPPMKYFQGGRVDVYELYCSWNY